MFLVITICIYGNFLNSWIQTHVPQKNRPKNDSEYSKSREEIPAFVVTFALLNILMKILFITDFYINISESRMAVGSKSLQIDLYI